MSLSNSIRAGMYGAMQVAGEYVATGAVQEMPIYRLDIQSDGDCYDFEFQINNPTGSSAALNFEFNGDTTAANYYISRFRHDTAIFSTTPRPNSATVTNHNANGTTVGWGKIIRERSTGKTKVFLWASELSGSSLDMRVVLLHYNVNANIVSANIRMTVAGSVGATSTFRIWKRGNAITHGTAFPTSGLVDGQRYFRDDLYLDCFYQASIGKWLTVQEYEMPITINGTQGSTTAATLTCYFAPPSDYQVFLTRFIFSLSVNGTNNGSNYWAFPLVWRTALNVATTILTISTIADAGSQWISRDQQIDALLDVTAKNIYTQNTTKTGTPGGVTIIPGLHYRKVIP